MSTLNATNLKNPSSASNNIVLDSSGRVLVGAASNNTQFGSSVQIVGASADATQLWQRSTTGTGGPELYLAKSRGTASSPTVVAADDAVGLIDFRGYSGAGANYVQAASIQAFVDGTPDSAGDTTDMPGRLIFSTTGDGSGAPSERMRINAAGEILLGKTSSTIAAAGIHFSASGGTGNFVASGARLFDCNRLVDDGELITFWQANVQEGSISVSGTTVSYNGAHLSRWSQLPSDQEREEILRGTVLSNIDEMCEWGEEDNEQLNRMKVSDVEGDNNVSGVFQAWDDDDDTYTNDFYCAMTGDFIIRIAEGVTVERGELLMSAGDGTAKPQDDDIIRSKTIAKVTSTNVSCTYDDGSYCVPCVLMAC